MIAVCNSAPSAPLSRNRVKSAMEFNSPTGSKTSIRASSNSIELSGSGGGSEAHENIDLGIIRPRLSPPECSFVFATRRTNEIEGWIKAIRNETHLEPKDETGLQGLALDSALHTSLVDMPPVTTAIVNTTVHSPSPKISSSNRNSKPKIAKKTKKSKICATTKSPGTRQKEISSCLCY